MVGKTTLFLALLFEIKKSSKIINYDAINFAKDQIRKKKLNFYDIVVHFNLVNIYEDLLSCKNRLQFLKRFEFNCVIKAVLYWTEFTNSCRDSKYKTNVLIEIDQQQSGLMIQGLISGDQELLKFAC